MIQPFRLQKVKILFNFRGSDTPPGVTPVTPLQIINESEEVQHWD